MESDDENMQYGGGRHGFGWIKLLQTGSALVDVLLAPCARGCWQRLFGDKCSNVFMGPYHGSRSDYSTSSAICDEEHIR